MFPVRHVVALLPQVPLNRARTCLLKHGLVKNPELTQAVEARQNAERLLSDTKEKAIRIANELENRQNKNWPVSVPRGRQLPTAGIVHHVLTSPSSWNQMLQAGSSSTTLDSLETKLSSTSRMTGVRPAKHTRRGTEPMAVTPTESGNQACRGTGDPEAVDQETQGGYCRDRVKDRRDVGRLRTW